MQSKRCRWLFSITKSSSYFLKVLCIKTYYYQVTIWGGSPGLVVMGGDSWSEGRGFESWHRKLDGYFFTHICCLNCNFSSKRPKINDKRGRGWPIFKKFDFTQVKHFHESLRLLWDIADSALKQNIKDALKRRFLKKESFGKVLGSGIIERSSWRSQFKFRSSLQFCRKIVIEKKRK